MLNIGGNSPDKAGQSNQEVAQRTDLVNLLQNGKRYSHFADTNGTANNFFTHIIHPLKELFEVLRQNGIGKHWNAGILGNRAYCVSGNDLKWGSKPSVESTSPYSRYTKCTFYGKDEPTFEPANDSEMRGFLGF